MALPRWCEGDADRAVATPEHTAAAVVRLSKVPSIRPGDGDAGASEIYRLTPLVAQRDVLGRTRRVDWLISEIHAGRTQLYVGTGAGQRDLLGTAGSVVGNGDGSIQSALVSRLEGNVDRAACPGCNGRRTGCSAAELARYSTGDDLQNPKTSVRKRDLLSRTGGKDDLRRKGQAIGGEGNSGQDPDATERK